MTDLAPSTGSTALAIRDDQADFTDDQKTALAHLGVGNASAGDLAVFFHVVKRTGLDPFARQIYMIGRDSSEKVGNDWVKVKKWTIQTGIDGFRLIGRRAADHAGVSISVSPPFWRHDDGSWRDVWSASWGQPIAARVTVTRDGQAFTATALFDEYVQTNRDGKPQALWATRPAGMLAKCAEALAWRIAFPQDLSAVYVDEELRPDPVDPAPAAPAPGGLRARAAARQTPPVQVSEKVLVEDQGNPLAAVQNGIRSADLGPDVVSGEEAGFEPAPAGGSPRASTRAQHAEISALLRGLGHKEKDAQLAEVRQMVGRPIGSAAELSDDEAAGVLQDLGRAVAGTAP